jgi:hypothetical protein
MRPSLAGNAVLDVPLFMLNAFDDIYLLFEKPVLAHDRLHIFDEPISNVADHDSLVSLIHLLNRDMLNVARDIVLAAEVKYFLSLVFHRSQSLQDFDKL